MASSMIARASDVMRLLALKMPAAAIVAHLAMMKIQRATGPKSIFMMKTSSSSMKIRRASFEVHPAIVKIAWASGVMQLLALKRLTAIRAARLAMMRIRPATRAKSIVTMKMSISSTKMRRASFDMHAAIVKIARAFDARWTFMRKMRRARHDRGDPLRSARKTTFDMTISRRERRRLTWAAASLLVLAACGSFKNDDYPEGGAAGEGGGEASGDASTGDGATGDDGTDGGGTKGGGADAAAGDAGGSGGTESGATDGGAGGTDAASTGDAGPAPDGAVSCIATGTADRRFPQWRLPPIAPGTGNYVVGSGTVLDLTTGLVWEHQPPPQKLDWADVNARCTALTTAGQNDWRVPTRAEILTILDYSQIMGQFLDPLIFGSTAPANGSLVWTSSSIDLVAQGTTGEFALDTYGSRTSVILTDSASLALSMCVRSGCVSAAANRFVVSADAVQDTATGLTWQRGTSASALSLSDAQTYCGGLTAGGLSSGWRLPSIRELASIFDETQHALPMWDGATFSTSAGTELWTSTPVAGDGAHEFTLGFSDDVVYGFVLIESTTGTTLGARCVHD
jgi:hypothetical protein